MNLPNGDAIREQERASIRSFVESAVNRYVTEGDRVLDFGCGLQPYRDLVESQRALYLGFDRREFPANVSTEDVGADEWRPWDETWDGLICTQVIQYVPDLPALFAAFREMLVDLAGVLILTGPTNWPEVEREDLHRHTVVGASSLVHSAGFDVLEAIPRLTLEAPGWTLSTGYGIIATPTERWLPQ